MDQDPLYTGTVGAPIRVVLLTGGEVHDPTDANLLRMVIVRPDRSKLTKNSPAVKVGVTSDADGNRPCLEYLTQDGDLNTGGDYWVLGYVEDDAGKWPAQPVSFNVKPRGW